MWVHAHHLSLLRTFAAGLGARTPLPHGPLGSSHLSNGIDGLPAASVVESRRVWPGGEVAVLDPGSWGFPYRQHLDGEGLRERGKAPQALQGGRGAAVAQQTPSQGDVGLHGHQFVIAVQQIASVLAAHGQVAVVLTTVAWGALLDIQMGCTSRDGNHILVTRPDGGRQWRILADAGTRYELSEVTQILTWRDPESLTLSYR